MKRLIILIMIAVGLGVQSQNTLSLTGGSGHPGDTVTVSLALANNDAVTALQTFIPLGNNLSYVPGSAALTDRSNGHQLTATMLDGSLRIYSYSLALASYNGNSGTLLTFRVVLGREPGSSTLTPSSTVISSAMGGSLPVGSSSGSVTVLAPKVQVTPASINYGHVPIRSNYTKNVTLKNIGNEPLTITGVSFSDTTLGCSLPTSLAAGAQQTITITYSPVQAGATAMTAVFHTNAKVGDSVLTITADPYAVNELRPLNVSGYTDSTVTVELRMNNMDSIVALQTSMKLPSALTYIVGSFAPDATRATGHTATAGLQGDTLTLLLTNLENTPLHGADGVVARFNLRLHGYGSHTLQLLQTALSDSTGANVLSAVYTGTVSIYSPYINCNSSMDLGNTPVTETATADLPLYNSGNAPLVIDHVVFMQEGWQLTNALPLTVTNYGRDTLHIVYSGVNEGVNNGELLLYTNDPRNELKRISLTAQRYEPNSLYLAGHIDANAASPEVDIVLDNYSAVTALQFDVQYPYSHFSFEPSDITVLERGDGHIVSAARQNDSTLRVLVLSMQNHPFVGNSGAVARMQLHAFDSTSTELYPVRLIGVTSACTDGLDRLTSIQTTGWFSTLVVHDTTVMEVHDTTFVDVPYPVHDTTYVDVPYPVHDTTYVDVHDTTFVDVPYPVHDTTYVDVPYTVYDTAYIDVHDTTYVDVPYPVHDTTYVNVPYPVHDTTYISVHDTIHHNVPYPIHDTTYINVPHYIHDTIVIDTLWLTQHDTVYIHDTIFVPQEGIGDVATVNAKIYQRDGMIVVEGDLEGAVRVYDVAGRLLTYTVANAPRRSATNSGEEPSCPSQVVVPVPAAGVYLVKIGDAPARRVVVIR